MFDFILSCIGIFVLCVLIIFALIWGILGLRAYLNWYRDEHSELYCYEIHVKKSSFNYSTDHRYFANSPSMALRKYYAEHDVPKDTIISVKLINKDEVNL